MHACVPVDVRSPLGDGILEREEVACEESWWTTRGRRPSASSFVSPSDGSQERFEQSWWTTRGRRPSASSFVSSSDGLQERFEQFEHGGTPVQYEVLAEEDVELEGPGSVFGSAITLVSTCVGTGLLALPFAFASLGVPWGLLVLGLAAAVSGAASYLLCQCCEWSQVFAYEQVMVASFGTQGALLMEVVVIWLLLGAMTSLLVVTGDTLTLVLDSSFLQTAARGIGRTRLVALDVCLVVLPLSCAQTMHSLRISNTAAVCCTLLVAAMLVARGVASDSGAAPAARAAPTGGSALRALPIIMLSLGCQVQVPCVYGELRRRSLQRIGGTLLSVGVLCFCLYASVAVAGLAVATESAKAVTVPGNVLECLPQGDAGALVMRAVMGVAVMLVYPMLCLPCRSTIDHLLFGGGAALPQRTPAIRARHAVETLLILSTTTTLATINHDLATVFGLTGATAGALICYLLPPACFLQMRRALPHAQRAASGGAAALCLLMLASIVPLCLVITWTELTAFWHGGPT